MGSPLCHHVLLKAVAADLNHLLMTGEIVKITENEFSCCLRSLESLEKFRIF